jgi:hypothetical protein
VIIFKRLIINVLQGIFVTVVKVANSLIRRQLRSPCTIASAIDRKVARPLNSDRKISRAQQQDSLVQEYGESRSDAMH